MDPRPRMPDPVRDAAVRAVLFVAVTLVQLLVLVLSALAGSWLAVPMVFSTLLSVILSTWGVLDIWITRQMWRQRHGVVSLPNSVARRRALGREG
ncbi:MULTISPECIES: hypothetical protein [Streptomyces]|nr:MULTISPECIES: hypothetical protein [Streptomyces]